MIRIRSVALACGLVAATLPAFAASSASASISNIQFQVIDLTPTDASVSGFSLASLPGSLSFNLSDSSQSASESYNYTRNGLGTYTKTAAGDLDTVSASLSVGLNSLSVQGQAGGPGTSYSATVSSNGSSYYYNGSIKLSAQSVLIITADALVKASATNPAACSSIYYYCDYTETASSSTWMNLSYSLPTPAGSVSGSSNNNLSINANARGEYSYQTYQGYDYSKPDWYNYPIYSTVVVPAFEQTLSDSRQFYAVFANTSNTEQTAYFNIGAQVGGRASTALPINLTPVPEPGTWALTLAGLGLIGAVARRRVS